MFTIGDIKNIAIQIEKNGEETYLNAAKAAKNPKVAELLKWIARQEARHAKWFSNFSSDKILTREEQKIEEMGRSLLQEMVKGNDFLLHPEELAKAETIKEVVEQSIRFEEDTILFYEFLLGCLDDKKLQGKLKEIITEEKGHIRQLIEIEDSYLETSENNDSR